MTADAFKPAAFKSDLTYCPEGRGTAAITVPVATCFDIYYKIKSTEKTFSEIAKGMTASWYAQKAHYDFATGKPKSPKKYKDVEGLTGMLWKGKVGDGAATEEYVAFAMRNGCAAARFCVTINQKVPTSTTDKTPK